MAANGTDGSTRTTTASGEPLLQGLSNERYLIAFPDAKNRYSYFFDVLRHGFIAQTTASPDVYANINYSLTWEERFSVGFLSILPMLKGPVHMLEVTGNAIVVNGGFFRTLLRFISTPIVKLFGRKGSFVAPTRESAAAIRKAATPTPPLVLPPTSSSSGSSSTTTTTTTSDSLIDNNDQIYPNASSDLGMFADPVEGDRSITYAMVMADSIAYEATKELAEQAVTNDWGMNFVGMYDCWNEAQQRVREREVIVFTDKAQDANAIVVSWRGTDPYNVDDWWTDLDFSWFDLGDMGSVHVGFLEALGVCNRHDLNTFVQLRQNRPGRREYKVSTTANRDTTGNIRSTPAASGSAQDTIEPAQDKILAYDYISELVKDLLEKNPNAKLFITGHSLGAALALLFTGLLYLCGQSAVADRIAGLYTVGQPRVGNEKFATFMTETLSVKRYYRVVYRNDLVARLPLDNPLWGFKHWGLCFYLSTYYKNQMMPDVPDPDYFNLWYQLVMYVTAIGGLVSSKASMTDRLIAFFLPILGPGIGDHGLDNYQNALRLGNPMPLDP